MRFLSGFFVWVLSGVLEKVSGLGCIGLEGIQVSCDRAVVFTGLHGSDLHGVSDYANHPRSKLPAVLMEGSGIAVLSFASEVVVFVD